MLVETIECRNDSQEVPYCHGKDPGLVSKSTDISDTREHLKEILTSDEIVAWFAHSCLGMLIVQSLVFKLSKSTIRALLFPQFQLLEDHAHMLMRLVVKCSMILGSHPRKRWRLKEI